MSIDTSKKRFLSDFDIVLQNQIAKEDATYTPFMTLHEVQMYDARIQTLDSMRKAIQRAAEKDKAG